VLNFAAIPTGKRFEGDERGDWELYDTEADRTELHNVASQHPDRVQFLKAAWAKWAQRVGVIPRAKWLAASRRASA